MGEISSLRYLLPKAKKTFVIYSYNLVMCVIVCMYPVRAKFQENEITFGPGSFWRWLWLSQGTWEK